MKLLIDMQGAQTESRFRGIGRQARALAYSLIEAASAHDVYILLNAELRDGLDELRREFLKILPADHIKVFGVPGRIRELERGNLWRMRAAELLRETFIAQLQPDVVYLTSLFEGVSDDAVTSIGLLRAPHATAATLFDLIPLFDPDAYLNADFMRTFYYRRTQSLKRADLLIAISESAKAEAVDMLQIPAERIDVALLAADRSFHKRLFSPGEEAALRKRYGLPKKFIFYVGAIEPRKNIPMILEAFGKLSLIERGDTALVFGGRLHEMERLQLQTAAVRFGVELSRLLLPGFIEEADLAALYSISSLFVFPSLQEGFGLPPLEAMACGAPVLVARNSSLPEVVGREDLMFDTFDSDELSRKMANILNDDEYSNEIRQWGVDRASLFSWQDNGNRTLASLERLYDRHLQANRHAVSFKRRPKLAFISPLPSDRTGIAAYGSELLRELACHYDIECIVSGTLVSDPWVTANFPLRNTAYFRNHADSYDHIIYQFGNSEFHAYMFDLLEEHPGVVILHDFFLSGIFDWLGNTGRRPPEDFVRQLYLTHGIPALVYLEQEGRSAAATRYPANRAVFANALGIIVHSQWSIDRAREIYGDAITERMLRIPHLRAVHRLPSRDAARKRLGIALDAFVACSFGFVAETKFGDRIISAWKDSQAGNHPASQLVFVGDHPPGPWGEEFREQMEKLHAGIDVQVTGYAEVATYQDYLAAADIAIQLRQNTRGETSGAILDCMAAGLPVIVNEHGTAAELPDDVILRIPDRFTTDGLTEAIDKLFANVGLGASLGRAAREEISRHHHPAQVGKQVSDAIEHFSAFSPGAREKALMQAVSGMHAPVLPSEHDFEKLARAVAQSARRLGPRRILYDITLLTDTDLHSGIERVVRGFLQQLLSTAPIGYVVEPVRFDGTQLRFARDYIAKKFSIRTDVLDDDIVDYDEGDVYIMLEWAAEILPRMADWLDDFRRFGGKVVIGIHDLLPLQMPHRFPDFIGGVSQRWFQTALAVADRLLCVSRCVADDVLKFGNALARPDQLPIAVGYFHIAADLKGSMPTKGLPKGSAVLLQMLRSRKTFLMVGTLEPRKGHKLVVEAFQKLWARGVDATLLIVGRRGWSVKSLEREMAHSREYGKRLLWVQDASDEYLEQIYRSATALIAASEGEGFGLPLIEAAAYDLPLIARDIPVFHEVAGESAFYFAAETDEGLADAIEQWLALDQAGSVPGSSALRPLNWRQSVDQFTQAMFSDEPYGFIGKQIDNRNTQDTPSTESEKERA